MYKTGPSVNIYLLLEGYFDFINHFQLKWMSQDHVANKGVQRKAQGAKSAHYERLIYHSKET